MVKQEVVKTILRLSKDRMKFGMVSNDSIYHEVTGLKNYSGKRWDQLRLILCEIAIERIINIDGTEYQFDTWQPMYGHRFVYDTGRRTNLPLYAEGFTVRIKK